MPCISMLTRQNSDRTHFLTSDDQETLLDAYEHRVILLRYATAAHYCFFSLPYVNCVSGLRSALTYLEQNRIHSFPS